MFNAQSGVIREREREQQQQVKVELENALNHL